MLIPYFEESRNIFRARVSVNPKCWRIEKPRRPVVSCATAAFDQFQVSSVMNAYKLIGPSLLAVLVLARTGLTAPSQGLSSEEQQIADYAAAHVEDAITTLQQIVDIESPTENLAGVKQVGATLSKEFEALGMTTHWIDMPADMKRAGHLVAETHGTQGKRLLLIGHIDTVLSGEKFRREGNKGYGTGTSDMKAGVVVLLYALKALDAAGALDNARIKVMLTGDEEDAGMPYEVSRGDLVAAAKESDAALSFEATIDDTATVGRRGASAWNIEVDGTTGHSGGIFGDVGSGAIFEASRILDGFYRSLKGPKYLTFNPSVILGGNMIPAGTRGCENCAGCGEENHNEEI